jgi:hypothetical protein
MDYEGVGPFLEQMQPEYFPLPDGVKLEGCWLMLEGQVNMEDLVSGRPGRIIRMRRPDALQYIPPSSDDYERIAGMISDAA